MAGETRAILIPLNLPLLDPSEVVAVGQALIFTSLCQRELPRENAAALWRLESQSPENIIFVQIQIGFDLI